MTAVALSERLRALVAEQLSLPVEEVGLDLDFEAFGLDSVEKVELLARIEDAFDVVVAPADAVHLATLDDVVRYLALRRA
ncbi:MAG: acyl carrier protein [Planctomycetota bacterium]|nr:MAG: acyl carrier protein [Planctomycetota bacterium]